MSTLTEIEAAVATLPRAEKQQLHARLAPATRTMIHLDPNFLNAALQAGSTESRQLRPWRQAGELFGLSTVAWAEDPCGPYAAGDGARAWAIL